MSPYSAKTRVLLRAAGVSFTDIEPTALQMSRYIKPNVGRIIMPTMRLHDGRWLQDSSNIADEFWPRESSKQQHFAARLLEFFADEWLPMLALHYRWNVKENSKTPCLCSWLQNYPVLSDDHSRANSRQKCRVTCRRWVSMNELMEALRRLPVRSSVLEQHLTETAFLLGKRPSWAISPFRSSLGPSVPRPWFPLSV